MTDSRKTHLDERDQLVEELQEVIRARDEFLTIAAHELRNPMQALLLQIGRALQNARRVGDQGLVENLERVQHTVKRYVERATVLLDVSRINAGHLQLHHEIVDFAALVRDVTESYAMEAAFNGATLTPAVPERLIGRWDRVALEQIVTNLVSNAIKYGAGAPVDVALVLKAPETAELTVRDHGVGIPAEDQARIFGRFEQVITDKMRSGFGVGLWLVRQLVEAHAGTIAVESAPDEGAKFTVRLPLDATSSERGKQ